MSLTLNLPARVVMSWMICGWVAVAAPAAEEAPQVSGETSTKCRLQDVGAPQRTQDNAAKLVTFSGTIENVGDASAHGSRVRFRIVGAKDDFVVDDQVVATEPPNIEPGQKASFKVSATWTGVGAHGGGKEVLTRELESCEAPAPPNAITGSGYCDLKFVGSLSGVGGGAAAASRMKGRIENAGPGTARDIRVSVGKDAGGGSGTKSATVAPNTLAPGETGEFELEMPPATEAADEAVRVVGYDCQTTSPPP